MWVLPSPHSHFPLHHVDWESLKWLQDSLLGCSLDFDEHTV